MFLYIFCLVLNLKIIPSIWIVISGVIPIIAIKPKASVNIFFSSAVHIPIINGNKNVVVNDPVAEPPESNAIAVNTLGVKRKNYN